MAPDEFFYAEQNARLVKNAEEYYRSMFRGRVSAWNLRDCHMAETLAAYEALFHELDLGRFLVVLRDGGAAIASLRQPRLERAIGVIYRPEKGILP